MTGDEPELTHISLFAGIGGIDIAAEWAGFRTLVMVENDGYCQKVLRKHWPEVPILGDIYNVTRERIEEAMAHAQSRQSGEQEAGNRGEDTGRGSEEEAVANSQNREQSELKKGDNSPDTQERYEFRTSNRGRGRDTSAGIKDGRGTTEAIPSTDGVKPISLITGGFPCQPVSTAGKQRGKEDDRWLWPEMLRVISEVRPTWVVAENVAGLLRMGFNDCISDLESIGYETTSFLIPACGVNAPHRRDRIFIVGYSKRKRIQGNRTDRKQEPRTHAGQGLSLRPSEDVANASRNTERDTDVQTDTESTGWEAWQISSGGSSGWEWWATEPELGRVAYGIPHRVDRLKCLGNAVVPQQIYPILQAIADIERG